jgi:hypothetical protein
VACLNKSPDPTGQGFFIASLTGLAKRSAPPCKPGDGLWQRSHAAISPGTAGKSVNFFYTFVKKMTSHSALLNFIILIKKDIFLMA